MVKSLLTLELKTHFLKILLEERTKKIKRKIMIKLSSELGMATGRLRAWDWSPRPRPRFKNRGDLNGDLHRVIRETGIPV